uniref:(northern house mosquito) hypothetical protein n=1 Tax=Culex pipiens TaxID=7175 RepID=A0A8D8BM75_CULPI
MAAKTINMATAHACTSKTQSHTHAHNNNTTKWQRTNNNQNQITIRNSIENVPNDTHGYCLCPHPFPSFPLFTSLHLCLCACVPLRSICCPFHLNPDHETKKP